EASKFEILLEENYLLGCDQQRGVSRHSASQVVDGMSLSGPRRAVKQKPFLGREPHLPDLLAHSDESRQIIFQQSNRFFGKDDVFTADWSKTMHFHIAGTPCVIERHFEGNHFAAICSARTDALFESIKELLRKLDACLAARRCDIDLYPQRHSHLHPTPDEYGEREAVVGRYPQRFPDAARRQSLTDINVVVLQGADIDREGSPLQQL